jgi:predicted MFS family arabinose efflux permease
MMRAGRGRVVTALGIAQTLAWASSYYLAAVLSGPMSMDLGVAPSTIFAAFSAALLAAAALGPIAGRSIDRWNGRPVLMSANVVFAIGLSALGMAHGPWGLFGAWLIMGIGMGSGLYEAAFATLVRLYGRDSRAAITGVTLFAGFASTVGWPLSAWFEAHLGWRGACFAWAALHVVVALPLNWSLPVPSSSNARRDGADDAIEHIAPAHPRRASLLLACVFAITWFISTAMAAHLPRLLMAGGATLGAAAAIGALIGPAQVAGRLLEFGFLRKLHPLLSARLASLLHPLAVGVLALFGAPAAAAFALIHGAGNGIMTIAVGTLPLMIFGSKGYGQRQGMLMIPARIVQSMAPWVFGVCLDRWGTRSLWLSAGLGVVSFVALLLLAKPSVASSTISSSSTR